MAQNWERLEALEEAERRGLLSPERQQALDEARRRGLLRPHPDVRRGMAQGPPEQAFDLPGSKRRAMGAGPPEQALRLPPGQQPYRRPRQELPGPVESVPALPGDVRSRPATPRALPPAAAPGERDTPGWMHRGGTRFDPAPSLRQRGLKPREPEVLDPEPYPGPVATSPRERAMGDVRRRARGQTAEDKSHLVNAVKNFFPSLGQLAIDITAPIHSPVETATGLWSLISDVPKMMPGGESPENLKAVADYMTERWGNPLESFGKDPAGMISDVAGVFLGGSTLALKAGATAGKAGQVARAAGTAGRALDLPSHMVRGAGAAVSGANRKLGVTDAITRSVADAGGIAPEAVQTAYGAGRMEGDVGRRKRGRLHGYRRGETPVDELPATVREGIQRRREQLDTREDELAAAFGHDQIRAGDPEMGVVGKTNPLYYSDRARQMEGIKNFDPREGNPADPGAFEAVKPAWRKFQGKRRSELQELSTDDLRVLYEEMAELEPDQRRAATSRVDDQFPPPMGGYDAPRRPPRPRPGQRGTEEPQAAPEPGEPIFEPGSRQPREGFDEDFPPGVDWNKELEWEIYAKPEFADDARYSDQKFHKHRVWESTKHHTLEEMLEDAVTVIEARRKAGFDHPGTKKILEPFVLANAPELLDDITPERSVRDPWVPSAEQAGGAPPHGEAPFVPSGSDPERAFLIENLTEALDPKSKEFRDYAIKRSPYSDAKLLGRQESKDFWRRTNLNQMMKRTELPQNVPRAMQRLRRSRQRLTANQQRREAYRARRGREAPAEQPSLQERMRAAERTAAEAGDGAQAAVRENVGDLNLRELWKGRNFLGGRKPNRVGHLSEGSQAVQRRLDQPVPVETARRVAGHKVDVDELATDVYEAVFRNVKSGIDTDPYSKAARGKAMDVVAELTMLPPDMHNVAGAHIMWQKLKNLEADPKQFRSGKPPKVVSRARHALEDSLRRQAPEEYLQIMDQISAEHRQVSGAEAVFSAYNRTPDEVALGKLENAWKRKGARGQHRWDLGQSLGIEDFDEQLAGLMMANDRSPRRSRLRLPLPLAGGISVGSPIGLSPKMIGALSSSAGSASRIGGAYPRAVMRRPLASAQASRASEQGDQEHLLELLARMMSSGQ